MMTACSIPARIMALRDTIRREYIIANQSDLRNVVIDRYYRLSELSAELNNLKLFMGYVDNAPNN